MAIWVAGSAVTGMLEAEGADFAPGKTIRVTPS